jgi:hypothetical protein
MLRARISLQDEGGSASEASYGGAVSYPSSLEHGDLHPGKLANGVATPNGSALAEL